MVSLTSLLLLEQNMSQNVSIIQLVENLKTATFIQFKKTFYRFTNPWISLMAKILILLDSPLTHSASFINVSKIVELRTITCGRDIFSTICSIKSFIRLSRLQMNIFIHSDITVGTWQKFLLKYHLPSAHLVQPADERSINTNRFSHITAFRKAWQGKKLIDTILMKKTVKVLIIDSDVCFYKYPEEIVQWIMKGKKNLIMKDYESFNILSKAEYIQYFGVKRISENINTGIIGLVDGVFKFDLKIIEKYLRIVKKIYTTDRKLSEDNVYSEFKRMNNHLIEQSVFCYLISLRPLFQILSLTKYFMYPMVIFRRTKRPFYPNMPVAIHYAGQANRRNYYLDYLLQNKFFGSLYNKLFCYYDNFLLIK